MNRRVHRVLALGCVVISLVIGGYLDYLAYCVASFSVDFKLATLIFIPVFIVLYWIGNLYDLLSHKDGDPVFSRGAASVLRWVYAVRVLAVCGVWLWTIYKYTYFFGNLIGEIKELLA